METLIERGCGLDVHKKSVAACVMRFPEPKGTRQSHVRTFGTMAAELAALREWLERPHLFLPPSGPREAAWPHALGQIHRLNT